jgi:hypothetical protein
MAQMPAPGLRLRRERLSQATARRVLVPVGIEVSGVLTRIGVGELLPLESPKPRIATSVAIRAS